MCVNCGNNSCSSCNESCYNPSSTSSLKYDGPKFNCPGKFTINPGDSLNDTLTTFFNAICFGDSSGNFAIQLPILEDVLGYKINLPANVPVSENITRVIVDRNLCSEDIIVTWVNLPIQIVQIPLDPVLYPSNASTLVMPWSNGNAPVITVPVGISAGNYAAILRFTTASCGIVDLPINIVVS